MFNSTRKKRCYNLRQRGSSNKAIQKSLMLTSKLSDEFNRLRRSQIEKDRVKLKYMGFEIVLAMGYGVLKSMVNHY